MSKKLPRHQISGLILVVCFLVTSCFGIKPPIANPQATPGKPSPSVVTPAGTALPDPSPAPPLPSASVGQTKNGVSIFLPFVGKNYAGTSPATSSDWSTVAGNLERTSWSLEEVSGDLDVEWYRPIEAYISQNTQIIASHGLLYISTARGLYALNAESGEVAWRFDTQLPLGNSPSVANGVLYVGGFDRKLHALDAQTGEYLWAFNGAQAGYSTNPLVLQDRVILGSRDGSMYAVGAHGTPNQGKLLWKYQTGGPIHLTAAYKGGAVYFASNDNHAYALRADNGGLIWKSEKLPGDGYQSFWPVIYGESVIFSAAPGYRHDMHPGTRTLDDDSGNAFGSFNRMQRNDLFFDITGGTVGAEVQTSQPWANGKTIIDGSRISEYLENNPNPDAHLHKPWRRVFIMLNLSDGKEVTTDFDGDGYPEYAPVARWGTNSGNSYPPIVGPDGLLYLNNVYSASGNQAAQGKVMGWNVGTPFFSVIGAQGAVDEPQSISGGGDLIYRSICCDRVGTYSHIKSDDSGGVLWDYSSTLAKQAPGYDQMWFNLQHPQNLPKLWGNYGTLNGVYHNSGDQNPIVPYQGRVYIHRGNAIIAFGPGSGPGELPLLEIQDVQDTTIPTPSTGELSARLEAEVQKIIAAGHLRPGYYNTGQFSQLKELNDYFVNPGDTLYTLAKAYPYLSSGLQEQTRAYLRREFQTYFDPNMVARIGWGEGAAREAMPLPPEVAASLAGFGNSNDAGEIYSWDYPPHNFYAMWKYAEIVPEDAGRAYELAKSRLDSPASNERLLEYPWEHNAYIAGNIGFLKLQELAGKSSADSQLRSQVENELTRLLQLRASSFSKDTPWTDDYHKRTMNVARNFLMLVPELGDYLNQNALAKVQEAVDEYNYTAPYWFVSRYNAVVNEGAMQPLYDYPAIFQAKAYILKETRQEITKYLDAPAFERGDLFYIQNLIAAIEAGP